MNETINLHGGVTSNDGTNCSVPPVLCECRNLNHAMVLLVITILGVSGEYTQQPCQTVYSLLTLAPYQIGFPPHVANSGTKH